MKKYISLILLFGLFSCVDEFDNSTTEKNENEVIVKVETTITGMVVDDSGIPVSNVSVEVAEFKTMTNQDGAFIFKDVAIDSKGEQIKSVSEAYFFGSSYIYPRAERVQSTLITLIKKSSPEIFMSTVGGSFNVGDSRIELSPNGFITEDSVLYNGPIHLNIKTLDPTLGNTSDLMPGSLRAIDGDEEDGTLISYSMMVVEMVNPSGDKILLDKNSMAKLTFSIPNGLIASAPDKIALWYFDETIGLWIEDGEAIKNGSSYEGEVSHFTFWNCDYFAASTLLSGRVLNLNGEPLRNLYVELSVQSNGSTAADFTDDEGYYKGLVPQNESFDLKIYSHCDLEYESIIGPFMDSDVTVPIVTLQLIDTVEILTMKLTGRLLNCVGDPMNLGRLNVLKDGQFFKYGSAGADGYFEIEFDQNCAMNELSIVGYDANELMTTDTIDFGYQPFLDLGDITTCSEEYEVSVAIFLEFWYIDRLFDIDFDLTNFEFTATAPNGPETIYIKLDGYNGLGNYTTGATGYYTDINTPWCTGDSITFDSLHVNVMKDNGKYLEGEFSPIAWTIHNDVPDECLGMGEVPFIIGTFILEY